MQVRIQFGRGRAVTRRSGKNSGIAKLGASLLTLVSISCASLSLWRVGTDLDIAGDFVFADGLFSHWQVWAGSAIAAQYASWRLARYAKNATPQPEPADQKSPADARAAVNG